MRALKIVGWSLILASPINAQALYQPPPAPIDLSNVTNTAQQALSAAQAAQASADASVKSVNGQTGSVSLAIPSLAGYATTSSVTSALAPYATASSLTSAINNEVTARNSAITAAQPNLAPYATTSALTTALAPYATTTSVSSAITAATPSPCGIPLPDSLMGTAGSGSTCMPRTDASRPTVIQAVTTVTASDGTFSGTWPAAFASTPTGRLATIEVTSASAAPYKCDFISGGVSATNFSGKCWQIVASTLPTTATALLGLVVSPIQNAAAGLTVRIVGRQ